MKKPTPKRQVKKSNDIKRIDVDELRGNEKPSRYDKDDSYKDWFANDENLR